MSTICCAWKRWYTAALNAMLRQPNGICLLGIVAVGLSAFGFYSMLSAVWFRTKRAKK